MTNPGKIKILYVHHGRGIGGAPLSLLYLLQKLDRKKYEPTVLCLYESKATDLYRHENIRTFVARAISVFNNTTLSCGNASVKGRIFNFACSMMKMPVSVVMTYLWVKKISPDIVHLNSAGLIAGAIGAKLAGKKVVWHIREPLFESLLGLRAFLSKVCIEKFSDKIIAIGKYEADRLFKSPKVTVIYNFVDFDRFNRDISGGSFRKEFNIRANQKVVSMLGGLSLVKGTMTVVEALATVRKVIPNVKLVIVGRYPITKNLGNKYYEKILNIVESKKIKDNIIFAGVRNDIPRILSASDVLVFPSTVPHSARPVIEAAAMGKPAIASNLGGLNELIVDDITGRLVPSEDSKKLAEAVLEVLLNEQKAKKMGETGYKRAKSLFDADVNAKMTFDVYEEISKDVERYFPGEGEKYVQ